jgi:AcrR family transcriptional regulator
VLDIAMTAYWQTDPADVSVNAICQMAGISKPSLYRAFGSEDGLSRAVLDRYAEQVLSEVFVILHGRTGLRETLRCAHRFRQRRSPDGNRLPVLQDARGQTPAWTGDAHAG